MGLLDGGLQLVMGQMFASLYPDGVLYRQMRTKDAGGDITLDNSSGEPIKVQCDRLTMMQRTLSGDRYTEGDVRLLVLQAPNGVVIDPIKTGDRIIDGYGKEYLISGPITSDPANSYWDMRGTPV